MRYASHLRLPRPAQRFTVDDKAGGKPIALVDGKKLTDFGLKDNDTVVFKDLGRQISYTTARSAPAAHRLHAKAPAAWRRVPCRPRLRCARGANRTQRALCPGPRARCSIWNTLGRW